MRILGFIVYVLSLQLPVKTLHGLFGGHDDFFRAAFCRHEVYECIHTLICAAEYSRNNC